MHTRFLHWTKIEFNASFNPAIRELINSTLARGDKPRGGTGRGETATRQQFNREAIAWNGQSYVSVYECVYVPQGEGEDLEPLWQ